MSTVSASDRSLHDCLEDTRKRANVLKGEKPFSEREHTQCKVDTNNINLARRAHELLFGKLVYIDALQVNIKRNVHTQFTLYSSIEADTQ